MNQVRKTAIAVALHYGTWIGVATIVEMIFGDSPARGAYGMLSGWWAALYVGYVAKIGMSAALPLCLIVLAGTSA